MAINMVKILWCLTVVVSIQMSSSTSQPKSKRQIFREQVLPASGGKIPEDAFRADRLALNRLNKEGISVPDGVLLEHRNVHSHPHINKIDPEDENFVIRVYQQSEHRYAPVEGRSLHNSPPSVASTYLIRPPIGREETNIRTPSQQRPHFQAIFNPGYHIHHPKFHQPPAFHHRPGPQNSHLRHPVTYHNYVPKPHPQVYHPIPVPFILPNKEIQEERAQAHIKKYDLSYPSAGGISGRIRWPLISDHHETLPSEYENALPPISNHYDYEHDPSLQFYDSSESLYPFEEFPDFLGFRFARKSGESHASGVVRSGEDKSKESNRVVNGEVHKRVLTVKCEGDAKC